MSLHARPVIAPRWVAGCWAAAVVSGAATILVSEGTSQATPRTLGPATVASYLERVAGPDARDIRVNGVYGSAHNGAWQFVAHLTWHDSAGAIHGGTTNLPALAGAPASISEFSPDRLSTEELIGWTSAMVQQVFTAVPQPDAPLAFVELQITEQQATVLTCAGEIGRPAACRVLDGQGRQVQSFDDQLADDPSAGALAVSRRGTMP